MRIVCSLIFLCSLSLWPAANALAAECKNISTRPNSSLWQCHRVKLLILKGTPEVRASEAGALLQSGLMSQELIQYFTDRLLKELETQPYWIHWIADQAVHLAVHFLHQQLPPEISAEILALAKAAQMQPALLRRAISLPDFSSYFHAFSDTWPFSSLPPFGCTSIAKRTTANEFYYGRNLDFSSAGIWDKYPLLVLHVPPPGSNELRHIAIGAEGLPFAGITGVNEAGITLAVHQNFTREHHLGIPMLLIGELLLRKAKTLDEAIAFLDKNRPGPMWTFVLTDLKAGKAVAVESSATKFFVRAMDGTEFAQTNHLLGKENQSEELLRASTKFNCELRYQTALKMLLSDPDTQFGIKNIFEILSYQSDPQGDLMAFNDIMKPLTIQTVIFVNPETGRFDHSTMHISESMAPAASGIFLKFSLDDLLHADSKNAIEFDGQPVLDPLSPKRLHQMQTAIAFAQYFDKKNLPEALNTLKDQKSVGAQLFRATAEYELKNYSAAFAIASEILPLPALQTEPDFVKAAFQRVKLLSLYATDRIPDAIAFANEILQANPKDAELRECAERIRAKKSLPWRLSKITYDFFSGNLRTRPVKSVSP